jgi:hypothetical protein
MRLQKESAASSKDKEGFQNESEEGISKISKLDQEEGIVKQLL